MEVKIFAVAQNVLHALPEYPQEQHIANHMNPVGVHKHGGKDIGEMKVGGPQAVERHEMVERIRVHHLQPELVQKNQDVGHDQQHRDDWLGVARLCDFDGKYHVPVTTAARAANSRSTRLSPRAIRLRISSRPRMPPRAPSAVQLSAAMALANSRASRMGIFCKTA